MFCRNCGNQLDDRAVFCPHCGVAVNGNIQPQYAPRPAANRGLVTAAKVFIILAFIALAISFIMVLCLTISSAVFVDATADSAEDTFIFGAFLVYLIFIVIFGVLNIIFGAKALKNIKAGIKPSVALSVCVLLFTNLIAGILLLCTKKEDYV